MRVHIMSSELDEKTLIPAGSTVADAVELATGSRDSDKYTVNVNGAPASFGQALNDGDRVTIAPSKVKGA